MKKSECTRCRWRWATGLAFAGVLGFSAGLQAQTGGQTPKLLNLDGTPALKSSTSIEALPPGPVQVVYSVQSGQGSVSAGSSGSAIVYLNDTFSGFGAFDNYNSSTGLIFPGTMISDNLGLGNGFAPGGTISSYNLDVFRSSLDPQPGLADVHVELWDGDPFCVIDTVGDGYTCMPIAGSEADFVGLPGAAFLHLDSGALKGVTAPNTRVWMTISTSETANPAPCRLGWLISGLKPSIGNDLPDDLFENQFDDDGRANGGTCCIDGSACNATDPICAFCRDTGAICLSDADCPGSFCAGGAEDGDRGFCSDFDAESAFIFFFGGPCDGLPSDFCATFLAEVRSQAEATITLQPVSNNPDGSLDPGAAIVGNEILMDKGGSKVFLENRISDWDVVDNACVGGANDGLACTSGADCPDACINGLDNGNACTGDADCRNKCEGGTNDGLECATDADCPGGVCGLASCSNKGACGQQLKAWQASLDSSGYTSALKGTLTPCPVPCANDAECIAALGGNCSIGGESCAVDTDCAFFPIAACKGPECSFPPGVGGFCTPGWIADGRLDYVFAAPVADLPAVDLSTPDFRWASAVTGNPIDEPDPFPAGGLYAGSLALQVSANAAGTFTVGYFPPPASVLVNHRNAFIPLIGLVPGKITVRTGQCCDASLSCIDDTLTRNECEALGGSFDASKTCADPCACSTDADCDDGDLCTNDVCNPDGSCSNPAVDCGDGLTCTVDTCDPSVGCQHAPLDCDDGLGCTDDSCVEPGGCVNTPKDPDDGDPCTADSCLEPDGTIQNLNVIGQPCATVDDCPVGDDGVQVATGCSAAGECECVLCPDLFINTVGAGSPMCAEAGDKVTMHVMKSPSPEVTGAQFILLYDPSCMSFNSIVPGGDTDPASPFVLEISEIVDEAAGRIFYAVGVNPFGGVGTGLEARLATVSFTKIGSCNSCDVCFDSVNPQNTTVTFADGQGCFPNTICSDDVIDQDVLSISVPDDVKVNAECDFPTAIVTWDPPTASSDCAGPLAIECHGTHPGKDGIPGTADDLDMSALAMTGGEHPIGRTDYWCSATSDWCPGGKEITDSWTVVVNDQTTLDVTVQLSPWLMGNVHRCMKFELFSDCVHPPDIVETDLWFGGPFDFVGHFTDVIKVPPGQFACITARDQLHSLRSCDFPVCSGGVYTATFKGDPFFGGNWLTQGNLDGWKKESPTASLDVIDILDFGTFVSQFGHSVGPDTPCVGGTSPDGPHADINGDGVVDALDFSFVFDNFLASSKECCCGPAVAAPQGAPVTDVSVRDLRNVYGMPEAAIADINGDGRVNMDDMAAFLAGDRPTKKPTVRDRKGFGLRSR